MLYYTTNCFFLLFDNITNNQLNLYCSILTIVLKTMYKTNFFMVHEGQFWIWAQTIYIFKEVREIREVLVLLECLKQQQYLLNVIPTHMKYWHTAMISFFSTGACKSCAATKTLQNRTAWALTVKPSPANENTSHIHRIIFLQSNVCESEILEFIALHILYVKMTVKHLKSFLCSSSVFITLEH